MALYALLPCILYRDSTAPGRACKGLFRAFTGWPDLVNRAGTACAATSAPPPDTDGRPGDGRTRHASGNTSPHPSALIGSAPAPMTGEQEPRRDQATTGGTAPRAERPLLAATAPGPEGNGHGENTPRAGRDHRGRDHLRRTRTAGARAARTHPRQTLAGSCARQTEGRPSTDGRKEPPPVEDSPPVSAWREIAHFPAHGQLSRYAGVYSISRARKHAHRGTETPFSPRIHFMQVRRKNAENAQEGLLRWLVWRCGGMDKGKPRIHGYTGLYASHSNLIKFFRKNRRRRCPATV